MQAIQYTGSTMACHPFLSSMINYAQPIKFQSFETAESTYYTICICISIMIYNVIENGISSNTIRYTHYEIYQLPRRGFCIFWDKSFTISNI